ncbi:probable G-protein coupled receptor 139 [Rhincodon typus]|uniref:probable G-protein coupled receptor 139 n=1 Tax=Rhincodon typus TaxID=259920 RepID=UPI00202E1E69|nr:probable G-protein coupled receptor 139 [Rhincodon typus]
MEDASEDSYSDAICVELKNRDYEIAVLGPPNSQREAKEKICSQILERLKGVSVTQLRFFLMDELGEMEQQNFFCEPNLVTIIILSRGNCGISDCTCAYMQGMAAAAILIIFFNVTVHHIFRFHFIHSFFSCTGVCKFIIFMNAVSLYLVVWFTVLSTLDRYVAICCERLKTKYCRGRTATAVIMSISVLVFLGNVPYWFSYESEKVIDHLQWGCRPKENFFNSLADVAFSWLQSVCVVCLPFSSIFAFNLLTIRRIVVANRSRRNIRGCSSDSQRDPEVENRRKSIIFLLTISANFILLWLTAMVSFSATRISNTEDFQRGYAAPAYIATEAGYMLMYFHSCTNVCIYAAVQSKFRQELKKVLTSPWSGILKLVLQKES